MQWVKLKGSDFEITYPCNIRVDLPGGGYYFEMDTSQPQVVKCLPTILEDEGDGTYTQWSFSVWGPIGQHAPLPEGYEVVPLETKADFAEAERIEKMIERAMQSQNALVTAMRFAKGAT